MMGAASLILGLIYLLLWFQERTQPARLVFGVASISVAVLAVFELLLMQAPTPDRYADLLRWAHVPVAILTISLVGFVLLHFHAGRPWLALTVCALRMGALLANFMSGDNLNYKSIAELHRITVWDHGTIAVPVGDPNPWMLLGQLSNLLMMLFMLDAIRMVSRRGDGDQRRRATLVCGSIAMFVLLASTWTTAVVMLQAPAPLTINVAFLVVLMVMSHELGRDVIHAARLTRQLADSEAQLRASEQRTQLAVHAAGLELWSCDLDGNESWFTETGSVLLGLAPGEHITRESLLAHVHPDDHPAIEQARNEALHGTGEYVCEYRLLQPDGLRWMAARGRVEYAPTSASRLLRGLVLDITEQRKAEERFRLVIDGAPTAMLTVDRGGIITLANAQAERVFGYSGAELLGRDIDMLVPDALRVGHADRRNAFAAHPRTREMATGRELFGRRKDGSQVLVEISLTPIEIADELFVVASITDIGERVRLEQEIALQRDELAHLSRVTLLGEMSGSLAHELNQPLTAILSNAQAALRFLQRDHPDIGEVRDSLVHIVENDKRASEVIRRLRAMLRKDQSNYQQLAINDVVRDVLRLINSDLLNRNVAVTVDLASGLAPVNGDRVQLQQVLLNLVINACDAMEQMSTGRSLTVRTQAVPGSAIEVSISDVGRGIAPDALESIFNPFVTSKTDGIGLGLAICRTIIQGHRGTLRASNNASCGATLSFILPTDSRAVDLANPDLMFTDLRA
jgi:PAS domain S-box-containing protein